MRIPILILFMSKKISGKIDNVKNERRSYLMLTLQLPIKRDINESSSVTIIQTEHVNFDIRSNAFIKARSENIWLC